MSTSNTDQGSTPNVSTGRGGAGNIGKDPTVYTDGNIVKEGPQGELEYSTGRGGAGNISREHAENAKASASSAAATGTTDTVVPEPAMREGDYAEYHTGRGGSGNVHKDKYGGHSSQKEQQRAESKEREAGGGDGVKDKVKHALGLDKKEKGEKGSNE
ncbi:MAG: hypothetical protein M1831_007449 [Alyxoria varia]|nr:MAG: hypothetical protein M1831_007449 [Alyxoria varia]